MDISLLWMRKNIVGCLEECAAVFLEKYKK